MNFFNSTRIGVDDCSISQIDIQDKAQNNYMMESFYRSDCMRKEVEFATSQINVNYCAAGGWGDLVVHLRAKKPKIRVSESEKIVSILCLASSFGRGRRTCRFCLLGKSIRLEKAMGRERRMENRNARKTHPKGMESAREILRIQAISPFFEENPSGKHRIFG